MYNLSYFCCAIFCIFVPFSLFSESLGVTINAESAILINAKTGKVLYSKNESKKQYVASTTKIATCIYAIEKGSNLLDKKCIARQDALRTVSPHEKRKNNYAKCPSHWLESDASHIGLKTGEEVPLRDLLYGLMLASGDDAANVIADYFGEGSIDEFMQDLNGYLRSLGLQNTYFCNPSGLHHPEHISTAKDLATLARHAMKNALFRQIVSTVRYEKKATNKQPATVFYQSNRLLRKGEHYSPHAVGIKTGWHSAGLHSLVVACEKEGRLLIGVLLRTDDRKQMFRDAKALFEKAFLQKKVEKELLSQGVQSFQRDVEGAENALKTYTKTPFTISYYPAEEPNHRLLLTWDKVELPISQGQKVGELKLVDGDEVCATIPLFATERLEMSRFYRFKQKLFTREVLLTALFGLLAIGAWGLFKKKKS